MAYTLKWRFPTDLDLDQVPLVGRGQVLLRATWTLQGLDPEQGRPLWTYKSKAYPQQIAWSLLTGQDLVLAEGQPGLWCIRALEKQGQRRWDMDLRAQRVEGAAAEGLLWLLSSGEDRENLLRRVDAEGDLTGCWPIPAGSEGLVIGPNGPLFCVPGSGVYHFLTTEERIERLWAATVDSVELHGQHILLRGKKAELWVLDHAGRLCWSRKGVGKLPSLHDAVYTVIQDQDRWRPACLELGDGSVRWVIDLEKVRADWELKRLGAQVAAHGIGAVYLLDPATGALQQRLEGAYYGVGAAGLADGLLAMAQPDVLDCYCWEP
jgi:outer membrane protein assembly factor BamB